MIVLPSFSPLISFQIFLLNKMKDLDGCQHQGLRVAAIAQWMRLCLPSFTPGFESQAQHLRLAFYNFNLNYNVKKTKINKKRRVLDYI